MGSYNMGFKEFVALMIGLLHISLSNCQEFEVAEKQCVPYSSCSEISWLYQNGALQNEIDPLVWCHIDDMAIDNSNGGDIITSMISGGDSCVGHLQVYHVSQRRGLQLAKLHTRRRRNYSRLSRISNVYRVAVQGNCCWKLHQRPNFRGEFELLDLGFDAQFSGRFASAQAVEC